MTGTKAKEQYIDLSKIKGVSINQPKGYETDIVKVKVITSADKIGTTKKLYLYEKVNEKKADQVSKDKLIQLDNLTGPNSKIYLKVELPNKEIAYFLTEIKIGQPEIKNGNSSSDVLMSAQRVNASGQPSGEPVLVKIDYEVGKQRGEGQSAEVSPFFYPILAGLNVFPEAGAGALIGLAVGGPIGAIIGAGIGSMFGGNFNKPKTENTEFLDKIDIGNQTLPPNTKISVLGIEFPPDQNGKKNTIQFDSKKELDNYSEISEKNLKKLLKKCTSKYMPSPGNVTLEFKQSEFGNTTMPRGTFEGFNAEGAVFTFNYKLGPNRRLVPSEPWSVIVPVKNIVDITKSE